MTPSVYEQIKEENHTQRRRVTDERRDLPRGGRGGRWQHRNVTGPDQSLHSSF